MDESQGNRPPPRLERLALFSLVCQHFSSAWNERSYEFASYLYLIQLFPTTLLPASVFGLVTTAVGIWLSGSIGSLVDKHHRLPFIRSAITAQKLLQAASYAFLLILFLRENTERQLAYPLLAGVILTGAALGLASTGISVAIQRDWAVTIAQGSSAVLTQLNTYLRRVDLLCKLLAPLFVSLLTTVTSYPVSIMILMGLSLGTLVVELLWIAVVWKRFEILKTEEAARWQGRQSVVPASIRPPPWLSRITAAIRQQCRDFQDFYKSPIFLTSLAISLVYLTTLSFDGIMISYLKAERSFSDAFVAGMRGVCVVTGLGGTIIMPKLERKLGLVRAGAWSIWSQILCLVPVVISLYLATVPHSHGPAWNSALLFGGMSLSRIGLWSFDLIQLQMLQEALAAHPRRNALTGIQISLQNAFDLAKYIIVLGLNQPAQFKWTALISWIAVFAGGISYSTYLYRVRGHLAHWPSIRLRNSEDETASRSQCRDPAVVLRIRRSVAS